MVLRKYWFVLVLIIALAMVPSTVITAADEPAKLRSNDPSSENTTWNSDDFTYGEYSKLMYGCDYSRQFYVTGPVVTGFSETGIEKLKSGNTDLVIPEQTPEGETIVGVGNGAFHWTSSTDSESGALVINIGGYDVEVGEEDVEAGYCQLTSVRFPFGMLVPYDDLLTQNVTRRGNFIVDEAAFANNALEEVYLPTGVLACMANSFQNNQIRTVTLPRTIWWIENLAFSQNQISRVNFPQTCDFRLEMHGMPFARNRITSVRLPDFTEVVNKFSFAMNPGMEPMTEEIAKKYSSSNWERFMPGGDAESGIVYMYTDRQALFNQDRIHTIDRPTKSQWSPFQKLVLIGSESPDPDTDKWNCADFTYDGTTVTGLSESGILKRQTMTELEIPDRTPGGDWVREIADSDNAYGGLFGTEEEGFDTVKLPDGLLVIGDRAFARLGLKDIVFPPQLQEIGLAAFQGNSLQNAIIPDSVKVIKGGAFATNPTLKKITIPRNSSYTTIEGGTFGCSDAKHWMTNLTKIEIPDTITEIGQNAFAGNNFTKIDIPGSVTEIGRMAFSTKNYLKTPCELTLHEGLVTIGADAFRNKKIASVALPKSVTSIKENTFRKVDTDPETGHGTDNELVTRVYVSLQKQYDDKTNFPDSDYHKIYLNNPEIWTAEDFTFEPNDDNAVITGFSEQGFDKIRLNSRLTLPDQDGEAHPVTAVADGAFAEQGITSLSFTGNKLKDIGANAFSGNDLTELVLPEGLEQIGSGAFSDNKLMRVTFGKDLELIGEQAFEANQINGVTFAEGGTAALSIGPAAFSSNQLKAVQIPDRTDAVSGTAFSANPGIKTDPGIVYMYKPTDTGSAIDEIGNGRSTCQKLVVGEEPADMAPWGVRHFTFSEDGTTITGFSEDGELKVAEDPYVVFPGKSKDGTVITTIGTSAFEGYGGNHGIAEEGYQSPIRGVTFASSITTIEMKAFNTCAIEEIRIPDTITTLEPSAFGSNYGMKRIVLSRTLKEIPDGVFVTNATTMDMETGVHELVIPEGVTKIGTRAFAGQHIRELTLPDSLVEIGDYAFQNHQIQDLEIPAGVKSIGMRAFEVRQDGAAPMPQKLTLHEGLESIGSEAFGQTDLTSVEIPSTLTSLAADAFFDWKGNCRPDGAFVYLRTSIHDQAEAAGEYSEIATVGHHSKTGEGGHKVIYDKMVGTGWNYDDFTYSDDGATITGWSEQGNRKRLENHDLVLPDHPSYDSETDITAIGVKAFMLRTTSENSYSEPWYDSVLDEDGGNGYGEVSLGKYDCTSPYGIQRVIFPKELSVIGDNAFEYNNLQVLDLESAAELTKIGTSAFHGNHLFSVVIPDTITGSDNLGEGAFAMNNIFELTLSRNLTKIPKGCFSMNIRMDTIDIPEGVTEIDDMAFAGARLTELEIPSTVVRIGRKAFHLHHLTSLHIPGNVKVIDESAFEGTFKATTLSKVTFGEGIEEIGRYAFKEALIEEAELPDSIKVMGIDPFYNNKGKNGSGVVELTTDNADHLKFNQDQYHGQESGKPKHYYIVLLKPRTVTFNANGGTVSPKSAQTGADGRLTKLPKPQAPQKKAFEGWYTAASGGTKVGTANVYEKDAILYAHYTDLQDIAIYRVYNAKTKEHLWTASKNEYNTLPKYGWKQEGVAWYAPNQGQSVYRLYNPKSKDHHYTSSQNEAKVLTSKHGWTYDNNKKPVFCSGGSIPIYRLYNSKYKVGSHHLTASKNEYITLPKYGWKQEGTALNATRVK